MDADRLEETQRVVQEVVRVWMRPHTSWARPMLPDILQEATLAVLQAERTFDERRGAWAPFAQGAAYRALKRYAWRNRGPLVPPRPERGGRPVGVVSFLNMRRGGDATGREREVSSAVLEALEREHGPVDMEADFHRLQALERVVELLRKLDTSKRKMGFAVLVGEDTPAEAARRARVPVHEAYYARKNLTRRIAQSDELRALHQELNP